MSSVKYKHFYQLMSEKNSELLQKFLTIHNGYAVDPVQWEQQFHAVGREVLDVIRDWERRLCAGTEKSNYALYSSKLAEKFWEEVKKEYPLIDKVGLYKTA